MNLDFRPTRPRRIAESGGGGESTKLSHRNAGAIIRDSHGDISAGQVRSHLEEAGPIWQYRELQEGGTTSTIDLIIVNGAPRDPGRCGNDNPYQVNFFSWR